MVPPKLTRRVTRVAPCTCDRNSRGPCIGLFQPEQMPNVVAHGASKSHASRDARRAPDLEMKLERGPLYGPVPTRTNPNRGRAVVPPNFSSYLETKREEGPLYGPVPTRTNPNRGRAMVPPNFSLLSETVAVYRAVYRYVLDGTSSICRWISCCLPPEPSRPISAF
jgi:hypothetical protein